MPMNPFEPGARVGKYEVVAHVATGGMGAVYKALDLELRRTVALKVLPAGLAQDSTILARFRREARHAASLNHPNIVTLFEYGYEPEQDLHYLAMEFIDGINLWDYIQRRGQLQPDEARRVLIPVAKALDHAFLHGVVHRDIKPANILLARANKKTLVKLTDLGLARGDHDDEFKVTREGSTVGTIDYMAPEQARDSRCADIRSDIYSLGCTGYHMLAGKAPFADGGLGERLLKHLKASPPDVRQFNPAVSAGFWSILLKMLAKDPRERYATPGELLTDLKATKAEASGKKARRTKMERKDRRKTEFLQSQPPQPPDTSSEMPTTFTPFSDPAQPSSVEEQTGPPPASKKRPTKRRGKPVSEQASKAAQPEPTSVTLEQARAAAAFHERAVQVIAHGGGDDYARSLLTNCLKLDPFNTSYRKTLRDMNRQVSGSTLGRWFSSINVLALKSKMRLAHSNGDWRRVLEHGEEVLSCQPADVNTHLEMAEASQNLTAPQLAAWLLEQGRDQAPDSTDLMRALARCYEDRHEWKRAIALWENVRQIDPNDYEAGRKINDLAAQDHLASAHYRH